MSGWGWVGMTGWDQKTIERMNLQDEAWSHPSRAIQLGTASILIQDKYLSADLPQCLLHHYDNIIRVCDCQW